jgi:hypothetical protein
MTAPAVCEIDDCGVLAVGRCLSCGRAYCQTHEAYTSDWRRVGNVKRCSSCEKLAATERTDDAANAKYRDVLRRAQLAYEAEMVTALMAISHPTERLVRGIGQVRVQDRYVRPFSGRGYWKHAKYEPSTPELQALCPDPPWDDTQIASWFARTAVEPPVPVDHAGAKRALRSRRKGWWLDLELPSFDLDAVVHRSSADRFRQRSCVVIYDSGQIGCEPDYYPDPSRSGLLTLEAMHLICGCWHAGRYFGPLPQHDLPKFEEPQPPGLSGWTSTTP